MKRKFEEAEITIPCEMCSKSICLSDYERHSKNCTGSTEEESIPCEKCGNSFAVALFLNHRCARPSKKQKPNSWAETIPCEICGSSVSLKRLRDIRRASNLSYVA